MLWKWWILVSRERERVIEQDLGIPKVIAADYILKSGPPTMGYVSRLKNMRLKSKSRWDHMREMGEGDIWEEFSSRTDEDLSHDFHKRDLRTLSAYHDPFYEQS